MSKLPLLAVTMGDPAGVGPETIAGAWISPQVHDLCRPLVIGHPAVMRRAVKLLNLPVEVREIASPADAAPSPALMPVLNLVGDAAKDVGPSLLDARGGQAAVEAVTAGVELALAGEVDAIVTAPLNKAAMQAAGHHFPGHTELLGHLCGVPEVGMMLYLGPGTAVKGRVGLGVVHTTLHISLKRAIESLSSEEILVKARLADEVVRTLLGKVAAAKDPPRIGVCALNPHAGEQGLFGDEEITIIEPAVYAGLRAGLKLTGPVPADTLMTRAATGEFDAVVAMVHDQGHIALKLLDMHRAVNITLGLPIVRTSVAHGTAFDLAWQGKARCDGMVQAMLTAARLKNLRSQM